MIQQVRRSSETTAKLLEFSEFGSTHRHVSVPWSLLVCVKFTVIKGCLAVAFSLPSFLVDRSFSRLTASANRGDGYAHRELYSLFWIFGEGRRSIEGFASLHAHLAKAFQRLHFFLSAAFTRFTRSGEQSYRADQQDQFFADSRTRITQRNTRENGLILTEASRAILSSILSRRYYRAGVAGVEEVDTEEVVLAVARSARSTTEAPQSAPLFQSLFSFCSPRICVLPFTQSAPLKLCF